MHRIDDATAVGTLPTPAAAGTPGYFRWSSSGNGTRVTPDWVNAVQESLAGVIEGTGIALLKISGGVLVTSLLYQAIRRLAAFNASSISASGALTPDNAGTVLLDASAGSLVITLPAAVSGWWQFDLVRIDGITGNTVTINTAGGGDYYTPAQNTAVTSFTMALGERVQTKSLAGNAIQVRRTRDGDWTPLAGSSSGTIPAGYTGLEAEVTGGGGGAAGGDSTHSGGGGGAGATARATGRGIMSGGSYSWAAGAAGAGGGSGSNGVAGGDSTFSATWTGGSMAITAHGGAAGTFGGAGGAGGTATGGDDNFAGGAGGDGFASGSVAGGSGGASTLGGPGSGGKGGYNGSTTGTNGGAGAIRIRFKA